MGKARLDEQHDPRDVRALKAADVPDSQARAAAEAVAPKGEVATKTDIAELRGELTLVRWMVGFNLAISVALLWKVFVP